MAPLRELRRVGARLERGEMPERFWGNNGAIAPRVEPLGVDWSPVRSAGSRGSIEAFPCRSEHPRISCRGRKAPSRALEENS